MHSFQSVLKSMIQGSLEVHIEYVKCCLWRGCRSWGEGVCRAQSALHANRGPDDWTDWFDFFFLNNILCTEKVL